MLWRGLSRFPSINRKVFDRRSTQTNLDDFKTHYGLAPKTLCSVWHDLQTTNVPQASILDDLRSRKTQLDDFFLGLHWLKRYRSRKEMKILFGNCENTCKKWYTYYSIKIHFLKGQKIEWPPDDYWDTVFIISVDGVHFKVKEPKHETLRRDPSYYSHKHNKAGLNYEIAICIFSNRVVWVNGPFKASRHDKTIMVTDGLLEKIPAGKRVIADRVYRKVECVSIHNSMDCEEVRNFKRRVRSRQESFNERLERWESLKTCWKHGIADNKHKIVLDAVATLCVYQIELEEPLFDV